MKVKSNFDDGMSSVKGDEMSNKFTASKANLAALRWAMLASALRHYWLQDADGKVIEDGTSLKTYLFHGTSYGIKVTITCSIHKEGEEWIPTGEAIVDNGWERPLRPLSYDKGMYDVGLRLDEELNVMKNRAIVAITVVMIDKFGYTPEYLKWINPEKVFFVHPGHGTIGECMISFPLPERLNEEIDVYLEPFTMEAVGIDLHTTKGSSSHYWRKTKNEWVEET